METLWKVLSSLVVLFFFGLCNGLPINLENSGPDPHTQLLTGLVAVLLTVCSVVLLAGCLCCQRKSGFEEFRNSPVASSATIINSNQDHGHVNPIANSSSEFTIFTPISPPHHNNNVFLANQRIVSCSQEDYKDGDIDASSWFDGSEKDFPRTKLKYIRELGKGWFGRVVEGTAQNVSEDAGDSEWTPVVVRILEASATSRERLLFLNDATIYKCGYHPNILRLLGRSLDTVPLLLLQEYSAQGDLKKYLRMCKSSQDKLVSEDMPLRWCYQLTLALNFLHDRKLTHPDLSARNCQLSDDLSLKLGDYGLSAMYYPEDYYQGSPGVPLRWCAPEIISYTSTTIQTTPTTVESNIWALGITMWEILEWGEKPYSELTDDEVISQVLGISKVRLPRPTYHLIYTDYMYKIMQSCWYNVSSRVTIHQINLMMADLMHVYENTKVSFQTNSDIPSGGEAISLEDFDSRWNAMKPNSPVAEDSNAVERLQPSDNHQKSDRGQKSASMNNLHGSLDNLLGARQFDPMESWLENVASDTSDLSFVRGLSEAITDLDNAIAMENISLSPEFGNTNVATSGQMTSSGSETEDENWRRKIERGAYTEKVRQKSRSVADLMVLTHIDCSESDSETIPSLDYKVNQRVRYLKNVDNQKKFGSEGNLFHVQDDTFQEELKKLQEERRDSLLFVPDKFSECSFSEEAVAESVPMSLSNNRLDSLENSPVKKLMEKLNSPSEMVPPQQVYNVFNVRVRHMNVGGTICDKAERRINRKVDTTIRETDFSVVCDRPIESKPLEQDELSSLLNSDNQNNYFTPVNMNQNLELPENERHIRTFLHPFKDNTPTFSDFVKDENETCSEGDKSKNIETYPCRNSNSGVISNTYEINSTNNEKQDTYKAVRLSDESQLQLFEKRSETIDWPGPIQNERLLKQSAQDPIKTPNNFQIKIEILNDQNSTQKSHVTAPNHRTNNDVSSKEIFVTSKENNNNIKLKVPKLSEIIQRNAIDYKIHHHPSTNNDTTSVISNKSEDTEKLVHQEVVDKDSGLNTPENSASLEKLYDDNEEILDVGSFDSDRSNDTNKGTLLTDVSNDEESSNNEKKELCLTTHFHDYQKGREEEISSMIDFCVKKEARLVCDLFLDHERANFVTDLKDVHLSDRLHADKSVKQEIEVVAPLSCKDISGTEGKYSFLNYNDKSDVQSFIQAEVYHSSNLLKPLILLDELSTDRIDTRLSKKDIFESKNGTVLDKISPNLHQSLVSDETNKRLQDRHVFKKFGNIHEVYQVPEQEKENLLDENVNDQFEENSVTDKENDVCDTVGIFNPNLATLIENNSESSNLSTKTESRDVVLDKTDLHSASDNKEICNDNVSELPENKTTVRSSTCNLDSSKIDLSNVQCSNDNRDEQNCLETCSTQNCTAVVQVTSIKNEGICDNRDIDTRVQSDISNVVEIIERINLSELENEFRKGISESVEPIFKLVSNAENETKLTKGDARGNVELAVESSAEHKQDEKILTEDNFPLQEITLNESNEQDIALKNAYADISIEYLQQLPLREVKKEHSEILNATKQFLHNEIEYYAKHHGLQSSIVEKEVKEIDLNDSSITTESEIGENNTKDGYRIEDESHPAFSESQISESNDTYIFDRNSLELLRNEQDQNACELIENFKETVMDELNKSEVKMPLTDLSDHNVEVVSIQCTEQPPDDERDIKQEDDPFFVVTHENIENKTGNELIDVPILSNSLKNLPEREEDQNLRHIQSTNFTDTTLRNGIEQTAMFLREEIDNYTPEAVQSFEHDKLLTSEIEYDNEFPYCEQTAQTSFDGVKSDLEVINNIEETVMPLDNEVDNGDFRQQPIILESNSFIKNTMDGESGIKEEAIVTDKNHTQTLHVVPAVEDHKMGYGDIDDSNTAEIDTVSEEKNEIEETSMFLKNEIESYVNNERRVDFDLSDTQEKMSLNSLTHLSTFTSTPFANRRTNESTVILGASDDYSIDYYTGLKTSIDPEEGDLQFSSNFVRQNNTSDLYSLETWDNFLGRSFDEQQSAAVDFNDFSHEPHSLLFLECDDERERHNNEVPMTKVLEETYNVDALPPTDDTFVKEKNENNANTTFNVTNDGENDKIEKELQKNPMTTATTTVGGWFLHPQCSTKESSSELTDNQETSAAVTAGGPEESYVGFSMDDEIMAAIRNELLTKLPHAQRASADHQIEETCEEMDSAERNEVFLRYNVYNTPLSPIPEESYDSEFGSGRITPKRINDTSDDEGDSSDWSVQEDNNSSNARTEEIVSPRFPESPARYRTDPYRHTPSQDSCCSNDTLFNVEELNGGLNDKVMVEPLFNFTIQLDNALDSIEDEASDSKYVDCSIEAQHILNGEQSDNKTTTGEEQRSTELPVIKTDHGYILDFLDNERYSEINVSLDAGEEISSTSDMYLTVSDNTCSYGQNIAPLNSPEDRPWKELQASFRECDEDKLPKTDTSFQEETSQESNNVENHILHTQDITTLDKQNVEFDTTQHVKGVDNSSFVCHVHELGEIEEMEDCVISDAEIDKILREEMESEMLSDQKVNENNLMEQTLNCDMRDCQTEALTSGNILNEDKDCCTPNEAKIYVNLIEIDAVPNNEKRDSTDDNTYVNVEKAELKCDAFANENLYANVRQTEEGVTTNDEIYVNLKKTDSGESFNTIDSSVSDVSINNSPVKHSAQFGYENLKSSRCDDNDLYCRIEDINDDEDKFSRFEDLFGPLTDIRFSGPGSSSQLMTTSFSESNDIGDDQDWDSGSDTRSSSSGEFIWKEGEHEASVKALRAPPQLEQVDYVTPMENIQEETISPESNRNNSSGSSSSGSEGEDECPEFVPSAWDKYATPTKSALRSPEKTLERSKEEKVQDEHTPKEKKSKGVSFKKQKYHCVYEYPREPESPVLQSYDLWKPTPDYATLSDWDLETDVYLPLSNLEIFENQSKRDNLPKNLYHLNTFTDVNIDEDFFVSSSSKPFDMLSGLTSQFFPGRQFSGDTWTDATNVTPDSGVEDIATPADFGNDETDSACGNTNKMKSQLTGVQSLKILAATAAERNGTRRELGGLRHTRNKLKLDLPPSPSAFTSNRTFSVDAAAEEIVTRQVPTFTTFGKSRFLVQHVDTPPDGERADKNVSFEALPHKKPEPQTLLVDTSEWKYQKRDKQKIESVRGEASLLDSADEDSGIESCTLDRKRFNI